MTMSPGSQPRNEATRTSTFSRSNGSGPAAGPGSATSTAKTFAAALSARNKIPSGPNAIGPADPMSAVPACSPYSLCSFTSSSSCKRQPSADYATQLNSRQLRERNRGGCRSARRKNGLRGRDVGAGTDILVMGRAEGLAVLREVPFHGLVHQLPAAGPELERDDGDALRGAGRHGLVRRNVRAGAGARGGRAAPRLPGDLVHQAGRVTAVVDLRRPDLAEPGAVGEDAGQLAERRRDGRRLRGRGRGAGGRGRAGRGRRAGGGGLRGRRGRGGGRARSGRGLAAGHGGEAGGGQGRGGAGPQPRAAAGARGGRDGDLVGAVHGLSISPLSAAARLQPGHRPATGSLSP